MSASPSSPHYPLPLPHHHHHESDASHTSRDSRPAALLLTCTLGVLLLGCVYVLYVINVLMHPTIYTASPSNLDASHSIMLFGGVCCTLLLILTLCIVCRYYYNITTSAPRERQHYALRIMIDTTPDMLIVCDEHMHVTYANPLFLHNTHYDAHTLMHTPTARFISNTVSDDASVSDDDSNTDTVRRRRHVTVQHTDNNNNNNANNNSSNNIDLHTPACEVRITRADGSTFDAEISHRVWPCSSRVLIIRDVSEKKRMMNALRDAQASAIDANKRKTDFLS